MTDSHAYDAEQRISELLLLWEELCERNEPASPELLCRDAPELLADLKRRIAALESMRNLMGTREGDGADTMAFGEFAIEFPVDDHLDTSTAYQRLRFHASGGKGEVHIARDESLGRDVAVKFLSPRIQVDSIDARRMLREAEITARLKHPGIVPVFGYGSDSQGRPFYCMQLVAGDSLQHAIRRFHDQEVEAFESSSNRMAFRQLLNHFVDVCKTVAYAHAEGIVHRDVKPANVLVGRFGETYVVDWGLAKDLSDEESDSEGVDGGNLSEEFVSATDSTRPGTAMGTPEFMSPEQALGRPIGASSDIFNLGATLYAILCGHGPYRNSDFSKLLSDARESKFPLPRELKANCSASLEAICLTAMAFEPQRRYSTPIELADDVEQWLADEPVSVHAGNWRERLGRWSRRHRTLMTTATAVWLVSTIALVAGTIAIGLEQDRTQTALIDSEKNFLEAEQQRTLAHENYRQARRAVNEFFHEVADNKLLNVPGLQALRKDLLVAALAYYQWFAQRAVDEPGLQLDLADAYERAARIESDAGDNQKAGEYIEKAAQIRDRVGFDDSESTDAQVAVAANQNQMGVLLIGQGKPREAIGYFERAIRIIQGVDEGQGSIQNRRILAHYMNGLALAVGPTGDRERAAELRQQAMDLSTELLSEQVDIDLLELSAMLHFNHSAHHFQDGRWQSAANHCNQSIRLCRELTETHANILEWKAMLASSLIKLAEIERARDAWGAAEPALIESREILEPLVDKNPRVTEWQSDLSENYTEQGRGLIGRDNAAAIIWLEKAFVIRDRIAKSNPTDIRYRFDTISAKCGIALLEMDQQSFQSAIETFRLSQEAFREMEKDFPDEPQVQNAVALVSVKIGECNVQLGQLMDAVEAYQEAVNIWRQLLNESDVPSHCLECGKSELALAVIFARQKNWDGAHDSLISGIERLQTLASDEDLRGEAIQVIAECEDRLSAIGEPTANHSWQKLLREARLRMTTEDEA